MISYFTYESRGTLKSFTFFIIARTITKLILGLIDKFEKKIKKWAVARVRVHQTTQNLNLVISRSCFAEDNKVMYEEL